MNRRENKYQAFEGVTAATEADHPRLAEVWESSVRATHHFLTENDIASIRRRLPQYFAAAGLIAFRDRDGSILGFAGVADGKLEMLFVDAGSRGLGVGKAMLGYAVSMMGAAKLDVNEQNPAAVGFYERMGFRVTGRSESDGEGRPFPLLHMELAGR